MRSSSSNPLEEAIEPAGDFSTFTRSSFDVSVCAVKMFAGFEEVEVEEAMYIAGFCMLLFGTDCSSVDELLVLLPKPNPRELDRVRCGGAEEVKDVRVGVCSLSRRLSSSSSLSDPTENRLLLPLAE